VSRARRVSETVRSTVSTLGFFTRSAHC